MQIIREVNFSDAEISILTEAGKLLGELKAAFNANEADRLSEGAENLIQAVRAVASEVLTFKKVDETL